MNLNVNTWKEHRIDSIFDVSLSTGDLKPEFCDDGYIPLISSGENFNGIVKYISEDGDGQAQIFDGNKITVDMFCHAFYQPKPFYAVSHGRVNILTPKFELNEYSGLFISTVINKEIYKYSYGRAVYSNVLSNMIIKLPTTSDGNLDLNFMERYIKNLGCEPVKTDIAGNNVPSLNIDDWKDFSIKNLFKIYTGKDLIMSDTEEGNIPVASNSCENNNIACFVNNIDDREIFDHNVSLSIADRGKFWAFVQPKDFYIGTRAKALVWNKEHEITISQLSFIATIINQESFKYCYGRNCCDKLPSIIIKLPVQHTSDGDAVYDSDMKYSDEGFIPDWDFMDNYINSLPYSDLI